MHHSFSVESWSCEACSAWAPTWCWPDGPWLQRASPSLPRPYRWHLAALALTLGWGQSHQGVGAFTCSQGRRVTTERWNTELWRGHTGCVMHNEWGRCSPWIICWVILVFLRHCHVQQLLISIKTLSGSATNNGSDSPPLRGHELCQVQQLLILLPSPLCLLDRWVQPLEPASGAPPCMVKPALNLPLESC